MNKIIIALLAGFAAGILLAPDKGSITRKKISDGFDGLSDKLSDFAEKFTPENTAATGEASAIPKLSAAL